MAVSEAFSRGFETYKKNFFGLLILSLLKFVLPVAFILASLILLIPLIGMSDWYRIIAYLVGVGIFAVSAFFMAVPFFEYPLMSGAFTALKKKPKIGDAFVSVKNNYPKLLIDGFIYIALAIFLFIESVALIFISPVFGTVALIAAAYVLIRLYFWDALIFFGEPHPLRASWKLTENRVLPALGFLVVSALFGYLIGLATSFIPLSGLVIGFVVMPFFVSAKIHFVKLMREGLKKDRA